MKTIYFLIPVLFAAFIAQGSASSWDQDSAAVSQAMTAQFQASAKRKKDRASFQPIALRHEPWVCNAYGLQGGARSHWRTVPGERRPTRESAERSALWECKNYYHLFACRLSGCWRD